MGTSIQSHSAPAAMQAVPANTTATPTSGPGGAAGGGPGAGGPVGKPPAPWAGDVACAVLQGLKGSLGALAGAADALSPGTGESAAGKVLRGAERALDALAPCAGGAGDAARGAGRSGNDVGHRTGPGLNSDELMLIKQKLKEKEMLDRLHQRQMDVIRNIR